MNQSFEEKKDDIKLHKEKESKEIKKQIMAKEYSKKSNISSEKQQASTIGLESSGNIPLGANVIPADEISKAPKLILEIIESQTLEPGKKYTINACGCENSQRKSQDGCVYIGSKKKDPVTGEYDNDIIIPETEQGIGAVHLLIQYKRDSKSYFIKDNGQGTGTFLKIVKPLMLKLNYVISFGDSSMAISSALGDAIEVKFLDGTKADQKLYKN